MTAVLQSQILVGHHFLFPVERLTGKDYHDGRVVLLCCVACMFQARIIARYLYPDFDLLNSVNGQTLRLLGTVKKIQHGQTSSGA